MVPIHPDFAATGATRTHHTKTTSQDDEPLRTESDGTHGHREIRRRGDAQCVDAASAPHQLDPISLQLARCSDGRLSLVSAYRSRMVTRSGEANHALPVSST